METIDSQSTKKSRLKDTASLAQFNALLEFFEKHRHLAAGTHMSLDTRLESRQLWNQIVTTLNGMGTHKKTTKQWQKFWSDKKYLARKATLDRLADRLNNGKHSLELDGDDYNARIMAILGPMDVFSNTNVVQGVKNTSSNLLQRLKESREKESEVILVEESNGSEEIQNVGEDMECRYIDGVELEFHGFVNVDSHSPEIESLDIDHDSEQPRANLTDKADDIPQVQGSVNVDSHSPEMESLDMDHDSEEPRVNQKADEIPRVQGRKRRRLKQSYKVSPVHEKIFSVEERRAESDRRRNQELAGIKTAVVDLCRLVRQLIECHYEQ